MKKFSKFLAFITVLLALIIVGTVAFRTYSYNLKFKNGISNAANKAGSALDSAASAITDAIDKIAGTTASSGTSGNKSSSQAIPATAVTKNPETDNVQSQVKNPVAAGDLNSLWGKTGMKGLTVYEYGKTLLDKSGRDLYCRIAQSVSDIDSSLKVQSEVSPVNVKKIYEYFVYDHSEVFYMDGIDLRYTQTGKTYIYKFTFDYKYSKSTIVSMRTKMRGAAMTILSAADKYSTDYGKEKAIHDKLIKNCSYDIKAAENPKSTSYSFSAYGALVEHKAVCGGYAQSMKLLLSSAGIKTLYVTGSANGDSHAWNEVMIGGKWVYLDATFDDPVYMDKDGHYTSYNTVSYTYFNFKAKSDHVLGTFNSKNPFDDNSENYAVMPG